MDKARSIALILQNLHYVGEKKILNNVNHMILFVSPNVAVHLESVK